MNSITLRSTASLALLVVSSFVNAQESAPVQNGVASAGDQNQTALVELVTSEPDYTTLSRLRTFRGPYTDQDDPLLKQSHAAEALRTGVNPSDFLCKPPACERDKSTLLIKLATDAQAQRAMNSAHSGAETSDLLDQSKLTPIFADDLVSRVETAFRNSPSQAQRANPGEMPRNSKGYPVDLNRWRSLELPRGVNVDEAMTELSVDPRVEVVEPSFVRRILGKSSTNNEDDTGRGIQNIAANDPSKSDQWALSRTRTEEAWQWLDDNGYEPWGDRNIVIAVIDSGVDYTHEDLAGNMWVNTGEIPGNGIDDDNNGFIDDVHGADVVGGVNDHDGDPQDDNGHGTHVAGIIAAQGNNGIGIVGIAPNTQIMAIKAAQYSGALTPADISEAILYAYQQGADVINMSFGGGGRTVLEEEALAIAFSNAVLIAAAGNNGAYNDLNCGPFASPSYPAAYPYVLGVMAEREAVAENGDWLAGFSNWDCTARNGLEYEVMAPGVDIVSTIPGNGYAAWDGTSMAAPVASGIAALVRTRFYDKSVYSSRFVMGQVASTGTVKQSITPCRDCAPKNNASADALFAITDTPEPSLAYLKHYLFDSTDQAGNDGDGIVDAGETIDLALIIKNYWGMASNVEVTLAAQASGAVNPDPYVTFDIPTVSYDSIGSFNEDDNGLIYDDEQFITGINSPFRFTVAENTPNEHIIPLVVTITATNGLDPNDTNIYTTTSRFNLIVQRGRELPRVIDSDAAGTDGGLIDTDGVEDGVVTIDDSTLWLIDNPVLIAEGTTLKVGPGAILQFWGTQPDDTYAVFENSYLQVEGTLTIEGTAENRATLKPSDLFPDRGVVIDNRGVVTVNHANLFNLSKQYWGVPNYGNRPFEIIANSTIGRSNMGPIRIYRQDGSSGFTSVDGPIFTAEKLLASRISRLGWEHPYARETDNVTSRFSSPPIRSEYTTRTTTSYWGNLETSLIENSYVSADFPVTNNSVLLNNNQTWVNRYGETVTQGSRSNVNAGSVRSRPVVSATTQVDGITYALVWTTNPKGVIRRDIAEEAVHQVNNFAQTLGGSLAVYSSDEEREAIAQFTNSFYVSLDGVMPPSEILDLCGDNVDFCEYMQSERYSKSLYFYYGLHRDDDGWGWINGEEPVLNGYDPTNDINVTSIDHLEFLSARMYNIPRPYQTVAVLALIEIPDLLSRAEIQTSLDGWTAAQTYAADNNAILNQWWDPVPNHWMTVETPTKYNDFGLFNDTFDLTDIYWGTQSEELVRNAVKSFQTDFNKMPATLYPLRSSAPESAYPFVVNVEIKDGDGNARANARFAAEPTIWDVTFNRDMDTSIQPLVTFGPDVPFTDFTVPGDWLDARTWRGETTISPVATDGYQFIRVAGAVAADNPSLVTGDDKKRFRFEVITSGTESLNLQASGGEGFVDLSWNQDDYDTLLGFNIYRSTSPDSGFIRINQTLVGNGERAYKDVSVEPGIQYHYYFTVALDGSESEPSNTASATPVDTIKPILSHNIITTAPYGSTVLVQANVTDNIAVERVTLYYRPSGGSVYTSVEMVSTSGSTYRASIPASATLPPGVEYYIEATDGSSYAHSGRSASPNLIVVENSPVVTAVTPATGSSAGGDEITISGNNFAEGASVLLGNATCQNVTYVSSSRLTCVTPASAPELVAVTVENPDGARGVLTSGFTFLGNATSIALPEFQANQGQTKDIELSIDPVAGLQSFSAVISWDNSHLQLANVTAGPVVTGWDFSYTMVDENTVRIQAASGSRVTGSGGLAVIEFLVLAEGDASSVLDIETAQLNEGTIGVTLVDGSFSIFPGYAVSGLVRYWNADQTPIEALLTLNDQQERTSEANTGAYEFAGLLDQQHTIKIEKQDAPGAALRAYDASLILSHALGTATLSGPALQSADVSGDGTVSEQDAAKVLEIAAGLANLPFPNQAAPWTFTPKMRTFDSLTSSVNNANFTGLLMGDVSGNWPGTAVQSSRGIRLEVESVSEAGEARIKVFAGSSQGAQLVSAVELALTTSSHVSLLSVERTPATSAWLEPVITTSNNVIGLTTYDDVSGAFSGETHALTLTVSVTDGSQTIESLAGFVNETRVVDSTAMTIRSPDDADGDLILDADDAFPDDAAASLDSDGDGYPDEWNDNASQEQIESSDLQLDAFPDNPDESLDTDGDGIGNNTDTDDDGDGVEDGADALPLDASETLDTDNDGVGNNADADDDGDGFSDAEELTEGTDPLNEDDFPDLGGLNIILIKAAIDGARASP